MTSNEPSLATLDHIGTTCGVKADLGIFQVTSARLLHYAPFSALNTTKTCSKLALLSSQQLYGDSQHSSSLKPEGMVKKYLQESKRLVENAGNLRKQLLPCS